MAVPPSPTIVDSSSSISSKLVCRHATWVLARGPASSIRYPRGVARILWPRARRSAMSCTITCRDTSKRRARSDPTTGDPDRRSMLRIPRRRSSPDWIRSTRSVAGIRTHEIFPISTPEGMGSRQGLSEKNAAPARSGRGPCHTRDTGAAPGVSDLVHVAVRHRRGLLLLLREVGDQRLRGQQQRRDGGGVLHGHSLHLRPVA